MVTREFALSDLAARLAPWTGLPRCQAFYQVVNLSYEQPHSTIVTTNRGLPDWGEVFGDTVVAAGILDRLMHNAVVFNIKVQSWRLREHQALTTAMTDPTNRRSR